jgi:hypothetical protein
LDGGMMIFAMGAMNIFNPGALLSDRKPEEIMMDELRPQEEENIKK